MDNKQKCLKTVSVLNSHKFFKNRSNKFVSQPFQTLFPKTVSNMFETRFKHISKPFETCLKTV